MGKLYRRIVTMGMISLTLLLAWIYCLVEYRGELVYMIGVSVILIASVYMMLIFVVDLKYLKDEANQAKIDEAVEKLKETQAATDTEELERLVKALYVQVRKSNTALSTSFDMNAQSSEELKTAFTDSINKLAKVVVKYNQSSSESTVAAITEAGAKLSDTYEQLESMTMGINSISSGVNGVNEKMSDMTDQVSGIAGKLDGINGGIVINETAEAKEEKKVISAEEQIDMFGGIGLNQGDIDMLVNGGDEPELEEEETVEPVMEEPVASESVDIEETVSPVIAEPADPNKPMSPDDIAALIASMDGGASASETAEEENEADVIPFPGAGVQEDSAAAESVEIEEAVSPAIAEPADPNKPMSPDEIAALFASVSEGDAAQTEEAAPEPVAEENTDFSIPEPADPNKPMSPDEIAALLASMGV